MAAEPVSLGAGVVLPLGWAEASGWAVQPLSSMAAVSAPANKVRMCFIFMCSSFRFLVHKFIDERSTSNVADCYVFVNAFFQHFGKGQFCGKKDCPHSQPGCADSLLVTADYLPMRSAPRAASRSRRFT